ncbi:EAL domain-containing protein [Glutamicibacter sp. V16R2B1]|uniref:EAL domain-containing protein n=1 Tax=Glutamicibacter sp. V16R2B1 TaxID=2036207 RepID=UPI001485C23E|nr:EAL domain-containing protein [Glutamicibacter sp. V16R2B1]
MKFVFQPLIDVGSSSLLGFEALTRFADGLGPAQHFQAARDEGRLVELELRAIQGILEASALLPTGVLVTLNASGSTIESFAGSSLRLDPRLVWGLELNEQSDPAVCARARQLADAMGCLLLIDDAGVAHATRERIVQLHPDIVKLDRTMITGYEQDLRIRTLVDSLLQAANSIGAKTLAEGVETIGQLQLVERLGFDYAQGFHFSPGRPGEEIGVMLQDLDRRLGIGIPAPLTGVRTLGAREPDHRQYP